MAIHSPACLLCGSPMPPGHRGFYHARSCKDAVYHAFEIDLDPRRSQWALWLREILLEFAEFGGQWLALDTLDKHDRRELRWMKVGLARLARRKGNREAAVTFLRNYEEIYSEFFSGIRNRNPIQSARLNGGDVD